MSYSSIHTTGISPVPLKEKIQVHRNKKTSQKYSSSNPDFVPLPPIKTLLNPSFPTPPLKLPVLHLKLIRKTRGKGSHFTKRGIGFMERGKILCKEQKALVKQYQIVPPSAISQIWNQHKKKHTELSDTHWKLLKSKKNLRDLALQMFQNCPHCGL